MTSVPVWTPVYPAITPAAILGDLPFRIGSTELVIPQTVVPPNATGILVFAWAVLRGVNPKGAYWHVAALNDDAPSPFFSLLVGGDPTGASVTCNSQAFWLPMPVTRTLLVSLAGNSLPSKTNAGQVEIHGYVQ